MRRGVRSRSSQHFTCHRIDSAKDDCDQEEPLGKFIIQYTHFHDNSRSGASSPPASALNIRSQMPRSAQRTKRL